MIELRWWEPDSLFEPTTGSYVSLGSWEPDWWRTEWMLGRREWKDYETPEVPVRFDPNPVRRQARREAEDSLMNTTVDVGELLWPSYWNPGKAELMWEEMTNAPERPASSVQVDPAPNGITIHDVASLHNRHLKPHEFETLYMNHWIPETAIDIPQLTDEQRENIRDEWQRLYTGPGPGHVLEFPDDFDIRDFEPLMPE